MRQESILAIIALLALAAGSCRAASDQGIVIEVTSDTFTINGMRGKTTYKVCPELLTNTPYAENRFAPSAKFTDVKTGRKVGIEFYWNRCHWNGDWICTRIEVFPTEKEKENAKRKEEEEKENAIKKRQEMLDQEKGDFNFAVIGTGKG